MIIICFYLRYGIKLDILLTFHNHILRCAKARENFILVCLLLSA